MTITQLSFSSVFVALLLTEVHSLPKRNDLALNIQEECPTLHCTGLDCGLIEEREDCQVCACPIGSPARGCDRMPKKMWLDIMSNGCPNVTDINQTRRPAQKVIRWFRDIDPITKTDTCRSYTFPYCSAVDFNLWRSPRSLNECIFYCYSFAEQRRLGL